MVQTFGALKNSAETPGRGHKLGEFGHFGATSRWKILYSNLLKPVSRWWFQIFVIFIPTCGDDPIWRAYFSDRLKPPTRYVEWHKCTNPKASTIMISKISVALKCVQNVVACSVSPRSSIGVWSHHQHGIDIWDTIECYDVVPSLITLHPAVVGGNRCSWCCLTRFPRCCVVTTPKTSVCNRCWNMFSLIVWWVPFFCHFKKHQKTLHDWHRLRKVCIVYLVYFVHSDIVIGFLHMFPTCFS